MTFYAYLHAKPATVDASGIFYVGKGKGKRAYEIARSNKHHSNIVAKYGKESILVSKIDCSSEDIAFELEKGFIKCLRRMGVNLANLTDGGEGTSGLRQTEEHKRKLSAAHIGKTLSPEHCAKLSLANKGKASTKKGKPSPLKGRSLPEEQKARLSVSARNRTFKLKHSESAKVRIGESTSRSKWYTNGSANRRLQPEQVSSFEELGWYRGKSKILKG